MENKNFYGNWIGKFIEIDNNVIKCFLEVKNELGCNYYENT